MAKNITSTIPKTPTAPLVAVGLIGGWQVAATTKNRPLGGAILAACGIAAGSAWARESGAVTTAALSALYLGAFGGSHPLAKKIGAWPSVLAVTAGAAGAAYLVHDKS